ncbi:hypothetical protein C360_04633 [Cryptococcus neoformans Bt15]|nr:hypothetical protein C360_04633 [Cryptococcus neoformans var. grubii Bt15]
MSASMPNSSTLTHPVSHYHDPKALLPYYLSPASKYIHKVFTKETCCNDCCQVGHGYKTCPNCCPSVHSFACLVDSHEVLIQELTSQLADHPNLGTHLDAEPDLYALFHPPLVIQISAAADGRTSAAPPHPLRFLLDTGAGTSFFDPSVVAKLGWKVCKDAVEHMVRLAGGKPGPVVRDVTGGSFRVRNANFMVDGVVMALNGTYDGILGLNFCKRYGLLEQSPLLRRLLDSSGKVPMPSALRSTKLSAITPPNSVSLGAAETASYADIIAQLKSEFAEVFCDKLGDVADFPSVTKTKSGVRFEIILKPNATPAHAAPYRVPENLLPRFREMIAEHLNAGCLRYSSSPWASPAFLVKKPNGQHRLVCDFRALNNQTVPDMYPMGNIQDILHCATPLRSSIVKTPSSRH